MLTALQVQSDIYSMLRGSDLAKALTGGVYHAGMRPRNSMLEDATIKFTTGTTGEIEEGVVTINIFVQDIDSYGNGVMMENLSRMAELQRLADEWAAMLTAEKSDYLFSLQRPVWSEAEEQTHEHFVVVQLHYRYYNKQS